MEVLILTTAALAALSIYLYFKSKDYKNEADNLGSLLNDTLKDSDRALSDQKESERELSIVKGKYEELKDSSLTPDNSIPKSLHEEKVLHLVGELSSTKQALEETTAKFEKERGKAISNRVRLGQVGETFAAFHESFPYNRKETKALFQPVDLICFEDDEVIFIDVKTGNSQLSKKQRNIRDNIKAGRVRFEIHRFDENGYKVKEC